MPCGEGKEVYGQLSWSPKQGEEKMDEEGELAVPGAADEENVNEEYECITGLLDELSDQMGR